MKARWVLTVAISLALAVLAAQFANSWISDRLSAVDTQAEYASAVAAAMDIAAGTRIEATHLKMVQLPDEAKPQGGFSDPADVIGQVAKQQVYGGEIIVANRLSEVPGTSALAAVIAEGKRAITVRVDDVVGVSGFILPGSRVDVIAREGRGEYRTILENIKVLAVDKVVSQEKNEPVSARAVTLEVDPRQAEIIAKAGKLRLTLRNPEDDLLIASSDAGTAAVNAQAATEAPAAEDVESQRISLYAVDVIRGTQVSTTTVDY
jgi:pilus assembly protein CpaB